MSDGSSLPQLRTGLAGVDDERAYVLLEEARLRCEQLDAAAGGGAEHVSLRAVHRQLGLAGWAASADFDPVRRASLLLRARRRSVRPMQYSSAGHALAHVVITAEDALADGLVGAGKIDHLHLAHVHLLHALDLLHTHLYYTTASE